MKDEGSSLLIYVIDEHESKGTIIYYLATRLNKAYIIIESITHEYIYIFSIHLFIRGICGMTSYRRLKVL